MRSWLRLALQLHALESGIFESCLNCTTMELCMHRTSGREMLNSLFMVIVMSCLLINQIAGVINYALNIIVVFNDTHKLFKNSILL